MKRLIRLAGLSVCGAVLCVAENPLTADFRGEGERFKKSCEAGFSLSGIASCGELLFTDHPLHVAVGSLAPDNGVGVGLGIVGHWTTKNWRNTWDVDAVGSPNLSWRAGGYLTFVYSKVSPPKPGKGRPRNPATSQPNVVEEQPVLHAYAETDSLNKIGFFGIGASTPVTGRTVFGMRETITGGSFVLPVLKRMNLSLLGEANGRFVETRSAGGQGSPPIGQLYTPTTAPGLFMEEAFAQFGEGVRLRPSFAGDHIQLDYLANYQEFVGRNNYSFRRFTTDASHTLQIHANHRPVIHRDINGPDECSESKTNSDTSKDLACPGPTRDYEGSLQLRFLLNESIIPAGNVEPFYFQPTLGGSDINGNLMLASFQDYRFRAPNLMLFRAAFEHSIYKWPVGIALMLDEGKVGLHRSDMDFSHLQHSYSVGLTVHAGGLPVAHLMFSWGGHEGTHTTAAINSSLLGGGARPSLF
jgi:hypothetical protein